MRRTTRLRSQLVSKCFFFTVLFIIAGDFGAGIEAGCINYRPYNLLHSRLCTLLQKDESTWKANRDGISDHYVEVPADGIKHICEIVLQIPYMCDFGKQLQVS